MGREVRYHGVVKQVGEGYLQVGIMKSSSCISCSVKGHCSSAEAKERLVDVETTLATTYQLGQDVWLIGSVSTGWKALVYGVICPFLVVFISLIVFAAVMESELWAAIGALAMLAPYYIILYKNKESMKKQLSFSVLPFDENNN